MIQRIQSLYLLLTTIVSGIFLNGGFLRIISSEGSETFLRFSGVYQKAGETGPDLIGRLIPLTIISLLIPLISLTAIFLFKMRKLQLKLTIFLLILEILLILTGAFSAIKMVQSHPSSVIPELNILFPFMEIIFTFLAYIGIRKDELLIKSYDRLR
ncbi:MAG: DUF4293 domain-containing protein [Bacteroidales bacterium]|jgi:hypothetical protein|nr:DUF4293 domain-containing protein [Bacteroidales bacterium]